MAALHGNRDQTSSYDGIVAVLFTSFLIKRGYVTLNVFKGWQKCQPFLLNGFYALPVASSLVFVCRCFVFV